MKTVITITIAHWIIIILIIKLELDCYRGDW